MVDAMRSDGIGTRTIQYVHATLRAALEHAYREELVSRNVARLVRVEARKLLDATTEDRLHALWVLLLMLGLRRSEVCGLPLGSCRLRRPHASHHSDRAAGGREAA
ncbi:hypothetical protein [Pseudonocardia adelaidensis]|uniref:Tyr recombinase domain-containing protein n=1 Tax=Pseudonocardia adelaidensis TaxID=648754 RepID=A0ABP9NMD9_9PSEU